MFTITVCYLSAVLITRSLQLFTLWVEKYDGNNNSINKYLYLVYAWMILYLTSVNEESIQYTVPGEVPGYLIDGYASIIISIVSCTIASLMLFKIIHRQYLEQSFKAQFKH